MSDVRANGRVETDLLLNLNLDLHFNSTMLNQALSFRLWAANVIVDCIENTLYTKNATLDGVAFFDSEKSRALCVGCFSQFTVLLTVYKVNNYTQHQPCT